MSVFHVPWEGKEFLVARRVDGTMDFVVPDVGSFPLTLAQAETMVLALCASIAEIHRKDAPLEVV